MDDRRIKQIIHACPPGRRGDDTKERFVLVGAAESGKSTVLKQLKILYGSKAGFTPFEATFMRSVVHKNVISNLKTLVAGCATHTPVVGQDLAAKILALDDADVINEEIADILKNVWRDEGVRATWLQRSDIEIQDSLEYYMGRIAEIAKDDYDPSNEDILHSYTRTRGIMECEFIVDEREIVMYDVGGMRKERKKWANFIGEDVRAVIFLAALSGYDEYIHEDNTLNRQIEALELFGKVTKEVWVQNSRIVLFLNKSDLFAEKLRKVPFVVRSGPGRRNADFVGKEFIPGLSTIEEFGEAFEDACAYLKQLYNAQIHSSRKELNVHITCAISTGQMETTLASCMDVLLKINLEENGFT